MAIVSATLKPAEELVRQTTAHQPNESAAYRTARNALLVEEIELRRQVARVAALRRNLPPGGEVKGDYQFLGESSSVQGAIPSALQTCSGTRILCLSTTGCMNQSVRALARCARLY